MLSSGTMLSRYRIESCLGEGQSGTVYLAFDTAIERTVAIKCLKAVRSPRSREAENNQINVLFKEAKLIGQLNHPHIAAVFDMGTYDSLPYIVMEHIRGETLKSWLARARADRASVPQILSFVVMVARALHYVHQRGILHGDINPNNLMMTPQGTPKIMDFGVARRSLARGPAKWSMAGEEYVRGTRGYLAPELLVGSEIDARADVFSLGAVAYEWLSGYNPFLGDSLENARKALLEAPVPPLSKLGEFETELSRDIAQALARDPNQRFRSADALADALEAYQEKGTHHPYSSSASGGKQSKSFPRLKGRNLLFADFSESELAEVMQMARRETYHEGDVIIQEGTGGSTMYLVVKGRVSIRKTSENQELELSQVSTGECFGEMAVISQLPRSASAVALRSTEVIAISGAVLRSASPVLSMKLYRNLAALLSERVRGKDEQMLTFLKNDGTPRPPKRRFLFG
jgi:serine/threonine protein kinase